ncbi:MAG: hypothetical protein L0Y45_01840 [Woeseiaceae bacterium]|nr:hypothetical protein [Woeseiaceae bacterium]
MLLARHNSRRAKPELYHWEPVGHSLQVLICLHEIGDSYRTHHVDALKFEQFSADFLKLNPLGSCRC